VVLEIQPEPGRPEAPRDPRAIPRRAAVADRLLAPAAVGQPSASERAVVDIGGLVRRLLLFDGFILDSYGLQEFPALIDAFGVDGVMTLLESDVFAVRIDGVTIAQGGQSTATDKRLREGPLPLQSYQFMALQGSDAKQHASLRLQVIAEYLGQTRKAKKLKLAIVDRLVPPPASVWRDTLDSLYAALAAGSRTLHEAVATQLAEHLGTAVDSGAIDFRVHQLDDEDVQVESNLSAAFGLSEEDTHKVIERAFLGVAQVKKRIAEMKGYGALTGFRPEEMALLDFDARTTLELLGDAEARERDLERVIEIASLPDVRDAAANAVDVEALLELRETEEARRFRAWLTCTNGMDEAEIADALNTLGDRAARALGSRRAKVVRLAVSTGLGRAADLVVPGAGIGISAADHFLVEKLLPQPGPLSFLSKLYKSVFDI
jgi:hypothetical protein